MVDKLLMTRLRGILERFVASPPHADELHLASSVQWRTSAPDEGGAASTSPMLEVEALWACCESATLFKDQEAGQWGLELLSRDESERWTQRMKQDLPQDYRSSDVVVGAFLGDGDLLVVAPSEVGVRRVLVALEMEHRAEWVGVGAELVSFLEAYLARQGDKFWDVTQSRVRNVRDS